MDEPQVVDDQLGGRFRLKDGDAVAELTYRLRADRLVLIHTTVPEAMAGRGVGGRLVRAAVSRARHEDLRIVALCPFARRWLERHPSEIEHVSIAWPDAEAP